MSKKNKHLLLLGICSLLLVVIFYYKNSVLNSSRREPVSLHQVDIIFSNDGLYHGNFSTIEELNELIDNACKKEGSKFIFNDDVIIVDYPIEINNCDNLEIYGNNTRLIFPTNDLRNITLLQDVHQSDQSILVSDSSQFSLKKNYQIYSPSGEGDRLLEFQVNSIENNKINLENPVKYMSHVKSIPSNSKVIKELNFFKISKSNGILIKNFELDGLNVGNVNGHTIYSGILFEDDFNKVRKTKKYHSSNLTIDNCEFINLKGRAVAIYAVKDVIIQNSNATNISQEAFELDHLSTGKITNNHITNARVGIQLNDAYNSVVSGNSLNNVAIGVNIITHFDNEWLNTDNVVSENFISAKNSGVWFGEYAKQCNRKQSISQ